MREIREIPTLIGQSDVGDFLFFVSVPNVWVCFDLIFLYNYVVSLLPILLVSVALFSDKHRIHLYDNPEEENAIARVVYASQRPSTTRKTSQTITESST